MKNIVIDTNVLLSAFYSNRGTNYKLLSMIDSNKFIMKGANLKTLKRYCRIWNLELVQGCFLAQNKFWVPITVFITLVKLSLHPIFAL